MRDVLVIAPASFAQRRTFTLCSHEQRTSRMVRCRRGTTSTLCANTSGRPSRMSVSTSRRTPWKSPTRVSTRRSGLRSLMRRTVFATWAAPPSSRSSRSTMVITTYARPMPSRARAVFSGSRGSVSPPGSPVFTAQKRQPRVHVSPRIMMVAVPCPQHSKMLGQRASSQTVCRSRLRISSRSALNWACCSPAGRRTRNQSGFRAGKFMRLIQGRLRHGAWQDGPARAGARGSTRQLRFGTLVPCGESIGCGRLGPSRSCWASR